MLYIVFSFSPLHLLISLSPWPSVDVSLHFLQWSGLRVDWVLLSVATFLWNVEFLSLLLLYFGSAIVGIHIQDCTFWIFHLWLVNVFWHARGMTVRYLGRQTLCLALTHMQFLLLIGCSNPSRCCYENMSTLNVRFLCLFPQILIGLLNTWYYYSWGLAWIEKAAMGMRKWERSNEGQEAGSTGTEEGVTKQSGQCGHGWEAMVWFARGACRQSPGPPACGQLLPITCGLQKMECYNVLPWLSCRLLTGLCSSFFLLFVRCNLKKWPIFSLILWSLPWLTCKSPHLFFNLIRVLVNLSVYLISTIAFLLNILVSIHIKIIHRNAKPSAMLSDTTFFLLQPWHFLCTPASASVSISVHRVKLNPKALEGLSYTSIRQCLKFVLAYCLNGVTVSMCSGGP